MLGTGCGSLLSNRQFGVRRTHHAVTPLDDCWIAMLTPGRPIGGRRRYRSLHRFLVSRGWELDRECGDPCWIYPLAYGGVVIALDRAELDVPDLADLDRKSVV